MLCLCSVELSGLIDHTLLKPEATQEDILQLCREGREFGFAAVCINPCWVALAASELAGTAVHVCCVAGFPLGANETATKAAEAGRAVAQGAAEIDMVQNIGMLLSGELHAVHDDIAAVAEAAHSGGALLKVILETCLLSDEQKIAACEIAVRAGCDFVKTSTGFSKSGATVEDVRLMRKTVGARVGVKASGGIRTLETLREMVDAGATRIGTSSGVAILRALPGGASSKPPTPLHAAKVPGGYTDAY